MFMNENKQLLTHGIDISIVIFRKEKSHGN